jgi:hypothetical protein
MNTKKLASILVPLALAAAAFPASALSVTSVSLSVSPTHSDGPCPVKFTFTGKVTLNGRGEFRYKWERSDGAVDATGPHTAAYDGTHAAIVTETWTLGAATPAFHPFHGSVTLHVLVPNDTSSKPAVFTLDCGAPPPTVVAGVAGRPTIPAGTLPGGVPHQVTPAGCDGKPDLLPLLHTPMDGWVGVKNIGTGNAGPSRLLIKCQREGYAGPGGGCVDVPASAITAPFFPTPDGLGLNVPAIPCGKETSFPMAWWPNMKWPKGTYRFTAVADYTNVVAESNEGNNTATSTLVR